MDAHYSPGSNPIQQGTESPATPLHAAVSNRVAMTPSQAQHISSYAASGFELLPCSSIWCSGLTYDVSIPTGACRVGKRRQGQTNDLLEQDEGLEGGPGPARSLFNGRTSPVGEDVEGNSDSEDDSEGFFASNENDRGENSLVNHADIHWELYRVHLMDNFSSGQLSDMWDDKLCELDTGDDETAISIVEGGDGAGFSGYALRIMGGVGNAKIDRLWKHGITCNVGKAKPDLLSFDVLSKTADGESAVLFVTDSMDREVFVFIVGDHGRIGIQDELIDYSGSLHSPFYANKHYRVAFTFDWAQKTFSMAMNGSTVCMHVPFENESADGIAFLHICNSDYGSEVYWTDFEMLTKATDVPCDALPHQSRSLTSRPSLQENNAGDQTGIRFARSSYENRILSWNMTVSAPEGEKFCWKAFNKPERAVPIAQTSQFEIRLFDEKEIDDYNTTELQNNMLELFTCGRFTDLEFVAEGGRLFAHKCVVFERCPYLQSMVASGMVEASSSVIDLSQDVKIEHLRLLMHFIYSGKLEAPNETPVLLELLHIADRYLLAGMKRRVEAKLQTMLCDECFMSVATVADTAGCVALREACVVYAVEFFERVIKLPDYHTLDSRLMVDIQQRLVSKRLTPSR